jgi:hypothetical protein
MQTTLFLSSMNVRARIIPFLRVLYNIGSLCVVFIHGSVYHVYHVQSTFAPLV